MANLLPSTIFKFGRLTGQTGASGTVVAFIPPTDASLYVSANVNVTAAVTASFTVTCSYTDEGGTPRVLTLTFSQLTGTFLTTITAVTGVSAYEGVPLHIRAQANTAISIASAAGGTYTSVTYNIEGAIIQIA